MNEVNSIGGISSESLLLVDGSSLSTNYIDENGKNREYSRDTRATKRERKRERSRSKSISRGRDRRSSAKEKSKKRDRSRHRDSEKDRNSHRERDYKQEIKESYDYDNYRSRHKKSKDKNRDRDRDRDRDRHSRSRRSRSRTVENHDSRRRKRSRSHDARRDRERSRSRSHSYRNRSSRERSYSFEHERERSHTKEHGNRSSSHERTDTGRLESIKEEVRESRFDLTQTIQELMNSTTSTKNFSALFNCNSNDSINYEPSENSQDSTERKRRKKSRWGGTENDKTFIPGMPTILPSTLDPTQQEAYLVQLQIEEISRKLRTGELGIPMNPEERSPSPEPIYSSDGKRLNTREFRYRKKLEEQRHQLIQRMQSVNPEFKPPADYKPPVTRVIDKVLIPQEEHPDINFVGLLIGPRGNTLKAMEKETGAKIIIRGKGSVKEGKVGRKDGQPLAGEDEPLHAFITAPNPEAVKRAVDKIKDIIRQGIEVPEGHNDLRRMQLRELAQLNGTLRETDCPRCSNCGSIEHKSWLCPDKPNITNNILCTICGGAGHISKDCRSKAENPENSQAKIDEEYMSLMAELGEGPPAEQKASSDPLAQVHINRGYSIFDKKPATVQAIQAAPPVASEPPNPAVSSTNGVLAVATPPPSLPAVPPWGPPNGPVPLVMPPPPINAPPAPPPILPWLTAAQPPPPGGEPPPPPGTGPLHPLVPGVAPPLIPPPLAPNPLPGAHLPPWTAGFPSWGPPTGYAPPPPPPPCLPPPPGIGGLPQPPPPPPPAN